MRCVSLAAGAAFLAFAASPAAAGEGCCWGGPTVVYAAPPVTVVVPPTGYVLDPSDARQVYWVDEGGILPGPWFVRSAIPTYSEGGYVYPRAYPYVRSYLGDYAFTAPRRLGVRRPAIYGRRVLDRPRVVRAGLGIGHVAPPYHAYDYRPAPGARVITVP